MGESETDHGEHERRLIALTKEALKHSGEERHTWLTARCGDDAVLLASVQRMIQRYEDADTHDGDAVEGVSLSSAPAGHGGSSAWESFLDQLRSRGPLYTRYQVSGELARGGMGVIHRVFDQDARRPLAMKVILDGDPAPKGDASTIDDRLLGRFLEEAQITSQLDHPGIVPVHDIGIDGDGRVYFTMKLVRGQDLRAVIDRVNDVADSEWTLIRAIGVLVRVTEAMTYAHAKGVIHRDLKPANVMVGRFGEVYVMDWGLARIVGREDGKDLHIQGQVHPSASVMRSDRRDSTAPDDALLTMDGDVVGTPAYMPPEQAAGRLAELGPTSDVYAVGAMLYHLLSGHIPYVPPGARISNRTVLSRVTEGPPPPIEDQAPRAPAELASICQKAMARDRAQRYVSMEGFGDDLRAFLEQRVVQAHQTGLIARGRSWVLRHPGVSIVSLAALIVLAITSGLAWRQLRAEQRDTAARNYAAHVAAAARHLDKHDAASARQHLDACDPDLRGFEWDHLLLASDASASSFPLPDGFALNPFLQDPRPLAIRPGGDLVAFGLNGGVVSLLSRQTGEEVDRIQAGSRVEDLTFDSDGRYLAIASDDGIRRKDLWTGEMKSVSSVPTRSVAITRQGETVFWSSQSSDGPDRAWKVQEATSSGTREIARIQGEGELTIQVNSEGTRLLIKSQLGGKTRLWSGGAAPETVSLAPPSVLAPSDIGVLGLREDSGGIALVGNESGWPLKWSVPVSEPRFLLAAPLLAPKGWELVFIADGNILRRVTRSFSRLEREPTIEAMLGHSGRIRNLVVSPNGRWVVTTSEDMTWRVWGGAGTLHHVRPPHVQSFEGAIEMDPDGRTFWTRARVNAGLTRWDIAGAYRTAQERARYMDSEQRFVQHVEGEGPVGDRFFLSREPMLRHAPREATYHILPVEHRRPPHAFHPTEERVAVAVFAENEPGLIQVYRVGDPNPEVERRLEVTGVRSLAFLDDRRLAIAYDDGPVLLLDIDDPAPPPNSAR